MSGETCVSAIVTICPKCAGIGKEEKRESGYDTALVDCTYCVGSGRIVETITHRPFYPFGPRKH